MAGDEQTIDSNFLTAKFNLSVAFLLFSAVFQTGFFFTISMDLFSYLSIGKVIINTIAITPVFTIFAMFLYKAWQYFYAAAREGTELEDISLIRFFRLIFGRTELHGLVFWLVVISVLVVIGVVSRYFSVDSKPIEYGFLSVIQLLVAIAFGWELLWYISRLSYYADNYSFVYRAELIYAFCLFVIIAFIAGQLYGNHIAGERCDVVLADDTHTIDFLMALDDVVVYRDGEQTSFLNSSLVQKVVCPPTERNDENITELDKISYPP